MDWPIGDGQKDFHSSEIRKRKCRKQSKRPPRQRTPDNYTYSHQNEIISQKARKQSKLSRPSKTATNLPTEINPLPSTGSGILPPVDFKAIIDFDAQISTELGAISWAKTVQAELGDPVPLTKKEIEESLRKVAELDWPTDALPKDVNSSEVQKRKYRIEYKRHHSRRTVDNHTYSDQNEIFYGKDRQQPNISQPDIKFERKNKISKRLDSSVQKQSKSLTTSPPPWERNETEIEHETEDASRHRGRRRKMRTRKEEISRSESPTKQIRDEQRQDGGIEREVAGEKTKKRRSRKVRPHNTPDAEQLKEQDFSFAQKESGLQTESWQDIRTHKVHGSRHTKSAFDNTSNGNDIIRGHWADDVTNVRTNHFHSSELLVQSEPYPYDSVIQMEPLHRLFNDLGFGQPTPTPYGDRWVKTKQ